MAIINDRFFTNTYITGSGRQNYLRIDHLEDPLFTSFTLDIDFITSPLFYTIKYSDYGYPNVEGMGDKIEIALKDMYNTNISDDNGYDILPVLSASILDENKLGFGLQQNVYMDRPLYGAVEYIYMVDKRNGSAAQNDVIHDSNIFSEFPGSDPNWMNSYKLGDSVKNIVNDSDKVWAERNKKQNEEQISECDKILNSSKTEHEANEKEMKDLLEQCNKVRGRVVGGVDDDNNLKEEFTESELQKKIDSINNGVESFEQLKRDIVEWVNGELSNYQTKGSNIYMNNKCVQKIASYDDISFCSDAQKEVYEMELKGLYTDNFKNEYLYGGENSYLKKFEKLYNELIGNDKFLTKVDGDRGDVNPTSVKGKFGQKLETFGITDTTGKIQVIAMKEQPEWLNKVSDGVAAFGGGNDIIEKSKQLMTFQCDVDLSFVKFDSEMTKKNDEELAKYEDALDNVRYELYGGFDENGKTFDISNPTPDSLYGRYLEAKEKCENDDYSQALKAKMLAQSGATEMKNMLSIYDVDQNRNDAEYEASTTYINDPQPVLVNRKKSIVVSQTVLDMLGFISGMKNMTTKYPYIIQGITGLDTAYNKHYVIKDPYLGSGDDKITLTCLESLDLRVSSMFNRYFNAVYDRQYRRERVPVNLRRFNCIIYVHDVRNFISKMRFNNEGKLRSYNRVLELTDMYYSVIEFRFYDCEIVPEETGNIFNDVSNEAPSEMKKTNFTFTYGNCVVNFVPQSEVASHDTNKKVRD